MSFGSFTKYVLRIGQITSFDALKYDKPNFADLSRKEKIVNILKLTHLSLVIFLCFVAIILMIISLALQIKDHEALVSILTNIINTFLAIFKSITFLMNRKEMNRIKTILKLHFPETQAQQMKYKMEKHLKSFKLFQGLYILTFFGFFVSFSVKPIIEMIQNGGKKFLADVWLPFDGFKPFIFESVFAVLVFVFISSVSISILSNVMLITMILLTTRLLDNLKMDFIDSGDFPEKERKAEVERLIETHTTLMTVVEDIKNMYASVFLFNFAQTSILICVIGFQISTANDSAGIFMASFNCVAVLVKIFFICLCGQRVIDSSLGIADAIYEIKWYEEKDFKLRKDLNFVMFRAQNFSKLTAANFAVISLKYFAFILSSSFAYFVLLRSISMSE